MEPQHWPFIAVALLIGAKLVIDPEGTAEAFANLNWEIRNFERRLNAKGHPIFRRQRIDGRGFRVVGWALIAVGLGVAAVQ